MNISTATGCSQATLVASMIHSVIGPFPDFLPLLRLTQTCVPSQEHIGSFENYARPAIPQHFALVQFLGYAANRVIKILNEEEERSPCRPSNAICFRHIPPRRRGLRDWSIYRQSRQASATGRLYVNWRISPTMIRCSKQQTP